MGARLDDDRLPFAPAQRLAPPSAGGAGAMEPISAAAFLQHAAQIPLLWSAPEADRDARLQRRQFSSPYPDEPIWSGERGRRRSGYAADDGQIGGGGARGILRVLLRAFLVGVFVALLAASALAWVPPPALKSQAVQLGAVFAAAFVAGVLMMGGTPPIPP